MTTVQLFDESNRLKENDNPYLDLYLKEKESAGDMDRLFDPELDEDRREEMYNAMDCSIAEVGSKNCCRVCILISILGLFVGYSRRTSTLYHQAVWTGAYACVAGESHFVVTLASRSLKWVLVEDIGRGYCKNEALISNATI